MPISSPVIVLDRDIPHAEDIFSGVGRVMAVHGHEIASETVRKADILIVRSITRIDESLLSGSSVGFVGTATAGIDHLDTEFLSESGISWANAPGANAESVVEYVLASIAVIASRDNTPWQSRTLGVVGCGHVGERLCRRGEALGMRVLRNDPPRARAEDGGKFVPLSTLLAESDIVSIHTPLTVGGEDQTHRLLDKDAIATMKSGAWLIQSSRGGVVDEAAAVQARRSGRLGALVLDVFENEPDPDAESVAAADLATGHIAGYSRDAKRGGVLMIRDAVLEYLGSESAQDKESGPSHGDVQWPLDEQGTPMSPGHPDWLDAVVRQVMDIRADDARFRQVVRSANAAQAFHQYRADYPIRHAWSKYLASGNPSERKWLAALGFTVRNDGASSGD